MRFRIRETGFGYEIDFVPEPGALLHCIFYHLLAEQSRQKNNKIYKILEPSPGPETAPCVSGFCANQTKISAPIGRKLAGIGAESSGETRICPVFHRISCINILFCSICCVGKLHRNALKSAGVPRPSCSAENGGCPAWRGTRSGRPGSRPRRADGWGRRRRARWRSPGRRRRRP